MRAISERMKSPLLSQRVSEVFIKKPAAPKDTSSALPIAIVYALMDPRTHTIHYVGCTRDIDQRLAGHMSSAKTLQENFGAIDLGTSSDPVHRKAAWLNDLRLKSRKPTVILLASEPEPLARKVEQEFIALFAVHTELLQKHHSKPLSPPQEAPVFSQSLPLN